MEVKRRLTSIQTDNVGIAKRPLHGVVMRSLLPWWRRKYRSSKLPSGLDEIERKYLERVDWPRSVYKYSILRDQCTPFEHVDNRGKYTYKHDLTHPWCKSTSFKFDISLGRNKRALKKAAGLPKFGKKREALNGAMQWNQQIKSSPSLDKCYSIMPGYRTQQSRPGDEKVRLVWSVPIHIWQLECEAIDDAITRTISANKNMVKQVKLFYDTPEGVHKWVKHFYSEVKFWMNVDASQYDSTVQQHELASCVEYFAGEYELARLLAEYLSYSSLVMPERDINRSGGMPSGSKFTNLGDGWTNVNDIMESLHVMKLDRYVVCVLVNGDDISIGFNTKLTDANMGKLAKLSRREINPAKSVVGQYVWNSKWYADDNIITRPIGRVLNSMAFKEHQSDPITGSKEYVAISIAQQLKDVELHPMGSEFIKEVHKYDKYPIAKFTDKELIDAATTYVEDHGWRDDIQTPQELIATVRSSVYQKLG